MIVKVAIEAAGGSVYDYAVPQKMDSDIALGLRVRVPLGSRVVDGYVVEFIRQKSSPETDLPLFSGKAEEQSSGRNYRLRQVTAIVDPLPVYRRIF